jgi:hypothetical protein
LIASRLSGRAVSHTVVQRGAAPQENLVATKEGIGLAKFVQHLREEVRSAITEGREDTLRFLVKSIEVELEVAVEEETSGGGGLKFWVVSAEGKAADKHAVRQKIKLQLEPVEGGTGDVLMSGRVGALPAR